LFEGQIVEFVIEQINGEFEISVLPRILGGTHGDRRDEDDDYPNESRKHSFGSM
jgi:hypothetical protein